MKDGRHILICCQFLYIGLERSALSMRSAHVAAVSGRWYQLASPAACSYIVEEDSPIKAILYPWHYSREDAGNCASLLHTSAGAVNGIQMAQEIDPTVWKP